MYNSYHRLMTTLKSLYLLLSSVLIILLLIFIIINPDFVVRLQVTILNRYSLPVCNISGSFVGYFCVLPVGIMMSSGFVLCAVIFISQCHCHPVRHVHQAFFVLIINEANILLWNTVVTLIWSTTATMRCPYGVRQLTCAIVRMIAVHGTLL